MAHSDKKMNGDLVVGLDCSTTGIKAIAFNNKGTMAALAIEPIPLFSPQPHYYEQDPDDWWLSTQKALRKITRLVDPRRISALAISNQRETFVPLSSDGTCLRSAIVWLDERCKGEVESFSKRIGKNRIHRITGKPPDYAPVVYRLAWMKKHEPVLFNRIAMICDVQTYLVWKLSGSFKTSWSSADPFGLFDLKKKEWSSLIVNALGLKEDQLPKTYRTGTVLGRLSENASKSTGISANAVIIAGGGDGQVAGLGSNVLTSKHAYLNLGTAVVAGVYGKNYKTSKSFRTMSSCSEDGYYYECSLRAGTFALDWLVRNILNVDPLRQSDIYNQLEREAQEVPVGSDGLLHVPYLNGVMNPYWDINARGVFVGLSSSHRRGHLFRSILEGIAFEQRLAISSVEKAIGSKVEDLVAIGGGAASELWCHIMADVTGKNICLPENTEASALGAAIVAAVGTGWYRTFKEAATKMTRIKRIVRPDVKRQREYADVFARYKRIYPSLRKV